MNDLDRQLIALLRENARMPVVALAKKLRVARATVQNRIARLEQEGVIVGYTLRLKPEEEVHQIRAIMSLAVESNREEAVMRQLRGHVSVVTLHSVNGRWDLVAELRLDTLEAFDRLISTRPASCWPPTRCRCRGRGAQNALPGSCRKACSSVLEGRPNAALRCG